MFSLNKAWKWLKDHILCRAAAEEEQAIPLQIGSPTNFQRNTAVLPGFPETESKHAAGAFTQSTGSDNDPISRHFCASPAADLKRESSGYVSLSAGGGVAVEALIMAAVGGLSGVKCHLALQSGGGSTGLGNSSKADCRELMGVFFWEFEEVK